VKVENDVLNVLDSATVSGHVAVLTCGQLDRKMYLKVNQVLECAGGKWNRKEKGHVFDRDPSDVIDEIILTGEVTNAQKELGFFPTPLPVIERMLELAEIDPGMLVLEPSAGTGNIAREIAKITTVDCVEIDKGFISKWATDGIAGTIWCNDFLSMEPPAYLGAIYDRVIMNPPFAKQADIKHVTHAMDFLKPGGVLVSVMASGVTFRDNRLTADFRAFMEDHDGHIEPLDPGAFKESGTTVNTVLVKMTK